MGTPLLLLPQMKQHKSQFINEVVKVSELLLLENVQLVLNVPQEVLCQHHVQWDIIVLVALLLLLNAMMATFAKVLPHPQVVLLDWIVARMSISVHQVISVRPQVIYLCHVLLVVTAMPRE